MYACFNLVDLIITARHKMRADLK